MTNKSIIDMLTYNELKELRNKLAKDEIGLAFGKAQFWKDFKKGQRSWHTKDWKERRSEFLKDKCEICSSKEVLTLQHLYHPRKEFEYRKDIEKAYTKGYIDQYPDIDKTEFTLYVLEHYEYIPIPLCSNCKSRNPNKRTRKSPQYLCTGCRHEFDEPAYKSVEELIASLYENKEAMEVKDKCFVSKNEWRNKLNLSNIKYWLQRERSKNIDGEKIDKEAFLLFLDDNIKYLSFEDTITACKKCAAYFDLYKMELCPKCKENYKGVHYQTCISCLPEEKQIIALEKIKLGKDLGGMHINLGID